MIPVNKIRVMVVDDSMLARSMLIKGLSSHPQIEVVGYAVNALDAKTKVPQLKPDVMTLDVEMPGLNGIDFLKQFLPDHPLPVILVSSLNLKVFDALAAGAVDFVRKPEKEGYEAFIHTLTQKVLIASKAKVHLPSSAALTEPTLPTHGHPTINSLGKQVLIGLGASTGGTEATLEVMKRLPADIPGMVIVQHMPPGFTKMYADRLNRLCAMEVREGKDGDEIRPGLALVAPADYQARIVRTGTRYTLSCTYGEKVTGHRPSVNVLFRSMADNVACKMVGIIMTGMGEDGADGLLAMRKRGAYTIGQDKESCVVYGMPMVAYNKGAVVIQASCDNIAGTLMRHLKSLSMQ